MNNKVRVSKYMDRRLVDWVHNGYKLLEDFAKEITRLEVEGIPAEDLHNMYCEEFLDYLMEFDEHFGTNLKDEFFF